MQRNAYFVLGTITLFVSDFHTGLIVFSLVTWFSFILITGFLQELIVFRYRSQVFVRPWVCYDGSAIYGCLLIAKFAKS